MNINKLLDQARQDAIRYKLMLTIDDIKEIEITHDPTPTNPDQYSMSFECDGFTFDLKAPYDTIIDYTEVIAVNIDLTLAGLGY